MRLAANVALALRRLRHHPWRSFLLLQGTVWGVAVALYFPAVVGGTRRAALTDGTAIGADRITIAADPTAVENRPLTGADVARVRGAVEGAGIPLRGLSGVRVTKDVPGPKGVAGSLVWVSGDGSLAPARGLSLAAGRLPSAGRPDDVLVEGLLGRELSALAGDADDPTKALGARLPRPGGGEALVVGVLAPRPPALRRSNDLGFDTEHPVFRSLTGKLLLALGVPLGDDAWKRTDRCVLARDDALAVVDWIFLRVPAAEVRRAKGVAESALVDAGASAVLFYPPAFPLLLSKDLQRFQTVSLALFLACLTMGAMVMAHVGLLSAMRRAGEIAVHRAEGATRGDVRIQFLAEGAVLAAVGGVLGGVAAIGLAELRIRLEPATGITWAFPWTEAGIALAVAVVVGVLASVVPASRAAAVDPAGALADE